MQVAVKIMRSSPIGRLNRGLGNTDTGTVDACFVGTG